MIHLSDEQINKTYNLISQYYNKYLKNHGVVLPNLFRGTNYTKGALVLVYLAQGYPKTRIVSKTELTDFIKKYYPNTNDVQQARHLGAQNGWFILSGTRNDNSSYNIPSGNYKLVSLEKFYTDCTVHKQGA